MTPRENMIRTMRCEETEWIPIFTYVDPFNCPDPDSLPPPMAELFREKSGGWGKRHELVIPLSEYLGLDEYWLSGDTPYKIVLTGGIEETVRMNGSTEIRNIHTPSGMLEQITERPDPVSSPEGHITKHFINGPEDLPAWAEYVQSWSFVPSPENIANNKTVRNFVGDRGMVYHFGDGTPLGMMYRRYADITGLIYMTMDNEEELQAVLNLMEMKYLEAMKLMLTLSPEIDIFIGMDDTSTTIISPDMFEKYSVEFTDRRAEMALNAGKFYMHHSCGLIKNLLPLYRKTRISGVHAFTRPPLGNVTWEEGRRLMGNKISIHGWLGGHGPDADSRQIREEVRVQMDDARRAGGIFMEVSSANKLCGVDILRIRIDEARKYQRY